jgi:hypothetical protein
MRRYQVLRFRERALRIELELAGRLKEQVQAVGAKDMLRGAKQMKAKADQKRQASSAQSSFHKQIPVQIHFVVALHQ